MTPTWRSRFGQQIAAYLALKKSLGRRFFSETYLFIQFDRFLAERRAAKVTPAIFAEWAHTFDHVSPTVRRTRMRNIRNFCLYLRRTDRTCFVSDPGGFPAPHVARRPYIFSVEQIAQLLQPWIRLATGGPEQRHKNACRRFATLVSAMPSELSTAMRDTIARAPASVGTDWRKSRGTEIGAAEADDELDGGPVQPRC